MSRWTILGGVLAAVLLAGCDVPPPMAAPVEAERVCEAAERTGLTQGCRVLDAFQWINVGIDTNSAEAERICRGMVDAARQERLYFPGAWQLRIVRPASDTPLAVCALPQR